MLAVILSPIVVGNAWLLAERLVRRPKTGGTNA